MKADKQKTPLGEYRSLIPYFSRYRLSYILGLLCLVTVDAAQIIIPQFVRRAVDIISGGVFEWTELLVIGFWITGVMALIALGRFFWRYFIHGSSRRIETELREKLFEHLEALSWDFYQKNKIGDLMARSINDLGAVRQAIGMGLVALVDSVVMTSAILIIIFIQDASSALFSVIPLPLVTLLILFFGGAVGKKFRTAQETYSKMSDTVQETFAGIRVIKSFVKEWWFIKKFADTNNDYRRANMELVRLFGFFFPFVTFLSELTLLIMLVFGGIRVIRGQMSPGSMVAMFNYLSMMIWPLMGAGFMVNMVQRGAAGLARVNEVLRVVPSIRESEHPASRKSGHSDLPAIEVRNLEFAYNDNEKVLNDLTFTVNRGEWLGIMGRTGSGKSTLIKTFTRMIDPPAGTVRVFGLDVRDWALEDLRKLFAVSPQDSYLFSDSIENNIAYGLDYPVTSTNRSEAEGGSPLDPEKTGKATELASLAKDLQTFSRGAETLVGERGLTLSGGQKQRVAIARALVMDSEFLIFDDSLSAVDAETELKILEGLLGERKAEGRRKTTIIISHRVSTLRYADKVLVLEKGRIAESGRPSDLAAGGGFYARMAALQRLDQGPLNQGSSNQGLLDQGEAAHG